MEEYMNEAKNNDAIAKPSMENLLAYLHYQYPATRGNIPLEELCERVASLVAEVANWRKSANYLNSQCDQFKAEVERLKALNFDQRELLNGQDKQEIYLSTEISRLEKQLSAADRTGYERGVREAAEAYTIKMRKHHPDYIQHLELQVTQAILNLLNKKEIE